MTVYGQGSADPKTLEKYDHLPPDQAIIRAWTNDDPSPRWHALAIRDVHNSMPLLARAIERFVARDAEWRADEIRRRELADELKDDLFDYSIIAETGEELPVTFNGTVVGRAVVVAGPNNTLEVRGTLTNKPLMGQIRGQELGFVGHIPAIDAFLNDPKSLGIKRSRPTRPIETDQSEPSDPPASPQP